MARFTHVHSLCHDRSDGAEQRTDALDDVVPRLAKVRLVVDVNDGALGLLLQRRQLLKAHLPLRHCICTVQKSVVQ